MLFFLKFQKNNKKIRWLWIPTREKVDKKSVYSPCGGYETTTCYDRALRKGCRAILHGFSCARYVSKATKEIASSPAGPSAYAEPPAFQQRPCYGMRPFHLCGMAENTAFSSGLPVFSVFSLAAPWRHVPLIPLELQGSINPFLGCRLSKNSGSVMGCGCFISTAQWKYSLFL